MGRLEEVWGREQALAATYDWGVQQPIVGRIAALVLWGFDIRRLFASIDRLRTASPPTRILDVPCGGGLTFGALTPSLAHSYTAFDFSPTMLERAARKAEGMRLSGIRFQQGDVGTLPFADGSFDLVLSYNGLHCFADPERATRELSRVVAPGGVLRGTACVRGAGARFDALHALFRRLGIFGPACTADELFAWLAAGGLEVRSRERSGAVALFEARRPPT